MRAQVAQGVAYQRRYARSNDPVIAARGLWLHNIHKVTVPQCRKPVCEYGVSIPLIGEGDTMHRAI